MPMVNEEKHQNLGCGFLGESDLSVKPMPETVRVLEPFIQQMGGCFIQETFSCAVSPFSANAV